jgi:hypothetical protein
MSELLETALVTEGTTLYLGTSFFKVKEVREPTDPRFPGWTFVGHTFDNRRGVWGRECVRSATYEQKWRLATIDLPDIYFTAYLEPGDPAVVEDYANGSSLWSVEVKCKVIEFGEMHSRVKITGESFQFVKGAEYTVPSQRLYRRKVKK